MMSIQTKQFYTLGLALVRWMTGIILIRVGWEIFSMDKMSGYIQWLTDIHFPIPGIMAYLGKLAELFGGLSLVIGFGSRWLCIPVMITMFVITFIMGEGNISSDSFLLLLLSTVFLCLGAGTWSLDHLSLIQRKKKTKSIRILGMFFLLYIPSVDCWSQTREPWINKPFDQWPQIALVNEFKFKDGSGFEDTTLRYAGTSFLIKEARDTYAVTVKHVLFIAWRKLNNQVALADKLGQWIMYPKNERDKSFQVGPLVNEDPNEKLQDGFENGVLQRDWLVFRTSSIPAGFYPLTLRKTEANLHEKVYLTGNPYRFDHTLGLKGEIVKKEGSILLVQFDIPDSVFLGGASGSPLMDQNGQLIGIFSSVKMDSKTGKKLNIINSTNYLKDVLRAKKPLNQNLKPISALVDSLVFKNSVRHAMNVMQNLLVDPQAYYTYNMTWPDFKALDHTGQRLSKARRYKEAVYYYQSLLDLYPGFHLFILSLSEVYQVSGDNKKARHLLEKSLEKANPEIKMELEKKLEDLTRFRR